MKQPHGIVVPALVLSALLAICLHVSWTICGQRFFIRCEVQTDRETTVTLHAERGAGGGKPIGEPARLSPYPLRQSVQFAVHFPAFKKFVLAFESDASSVIFGQCRCLHDAYGLDAEKAIELVMTPLHDADLRDCEPSGFHELVKTGPKPRLQFDVNPLGLLRPGILPLLVTCFLCYPFCLLALLLPSRFRRRPRFRITSANTIFLVLSLAFWGLMPCAYLAARSSHVSVHVRQAKEKLHQPIPAGGKPVSLRRADGLEIAARLFQSVSGSLARGGILLLHGNYPQAQDFPLYSLLAQALADRGFRVLTMDFAGFGRSQTPFASAAARRFDLENETEAALAYLKSLAGGQTNLCIIGHSLGANPALRVGLRDPSVRTVVLFGPPRRARDRFHDPKDVEYFWLWSLAVNLRRYGLEEPPAWYGPERLQAYFLEHDMVNELAELRKWGHKPVHFLDGDREDQDDKDLVFLRNYAAQVSAPCEHATIRGADHNLNVQSANYWAFVMDFITGASGGDIPLPGSGAPADFDSVTYDPPTLQAAADTLARWCGQDEDRGAKAKALCRNILRALFPFR